jgi:hypothetical protein
LFGGAITQLPKFGQIVTSPGRKPSTSLGMTDGKHGTEFVAGDVASYVSTERMMNVLKVLLEAAYAY